MENELEKKEKKKTLWKGIAIGAGSVLGIRIMIRIATGWIIFVLTLFLLLFGKFQTGQSGNVVVNANSSITKLQSILSLIEDEYLFDYKPLDILDSMYTGLVNGLGDPYSVYYSADMLESKNEEMQGNYCGIGAMITMDTTTMEKTITNVFENSPAQVGGLLPGDIIVAVDDVDVTHMNLDDTVALIKGPEGTGVSVKVLREDTGLEFHLTRANVVMNHTTCSMITEDIGLIELSEFYENATEQMEEGINFLKENGAKQIILDLRGNPGGLFNSAIDIADMFLNDGIIVSEVDKNGNQKYHYATEGTIFDGDLVILVNENSASSSEILTAALSQHGRAVVIGTKTFGKGIVQTVYSMTDGTAVKLTTDYYYTPNGTCIHDIGIEPDIEVPESEDPDVDAPLEKAIEYLMQLR